ncbi:MAG: hypothetical protein ACKPKO_51330, partial [Candidatus Fonsibacter sp.]
MASAKKEHESAVMVFLREMQKDFMDDRKDRRCFQYLLQKQVVDMQDRLDRLEKGYQDLIARMATFEAAQTAVPGSSAPPSSAGSPAGSSGGG